VLYIVYTGLFFFGVVVGIYCCDIFVKAINFYWYDSDFTALFKVYSFSLYIPHLTSFLFFLFPSHVYSRGFQISFKMKYIFFLMLLLSFYLFGFLPDILYINFQFCVRNLLKVVCDFVYWVYLIYFAELLVPVYLIFLLLYSFACPCPLDSSSLGLLIRTIYNKILVIGLVMISFVFASCIIFRAAELISSCWSYLGFRVFIHALPFLYILSIDFKGKTIYFEKQSLPYVCL